MRLLRRRVWREGGQEAGGGQYRRVGRVLRPVAAAVAILPLSLAAAIAGPASSASADGTTVTYTATLNIPAPPASNFAGAGGGDGWALAMNATQVYNVFHHDSVLDVNCHNQADSSNCSGYPKVITGLNGGFQSSGQPGLYLDQATGRLYVFATEVSDNTGGVVCIDTTSSSSNPFCGFTPLTATGQGLSNGSYSEISDPVVVGSNWYAFNYFYSGSAPTGTEDELMCFSLTSFSGCSGEPFSLGLTGTYSIPAPAPSIAQFAGEVVVPINISGASGTEIYCYDPSTGANCAGSGWPIAGPTWAGSFGSAFPMLNAAAATTGFCIPNGGSNCYNLDGTAAAAPADLGTDVAANVVWDGPAVTEGPRVYVPNFNTNDVYCYDWSTDAECTTTPGSSFTFPRNFTNLGLLYTVNQDPNRPTCIWVNSDNGSEQIQNFDAFTGGACGNGPIRLLGSDMVAQPADCAPTQWTTLKITDPFPPSTYGGGSVEFENADGAALNPSDIGGVNPVTLDANASVDLSGYNFSTANDLPDFVITLNSPPANLASVTVQATWVANDSAGCIQPGTTANFVASANPGVVTFGNTVTLTGSGIPSGATGTVTFTSGSTALCSYDVATATSCVTAVLPAGAYPVTGSYTGDSTFAPATATTAFAVNFIADASPGLSTFGTPVTLSESGIAAGATGTVTFTYTPSGGSPVTLCTVTLGSATSCNAGALQPGIYAVTGTYPGDASNAGSSATTSFAVTQAPTKTTTQVIDNSTGTGWTNTELPGAVARTVGAVTNSASGTVTYTLYSGDNCEGTLLQTSQAAVQGGTAGSSAVSNPLPAGSYSYQASYAATTDFLGSTSSCAPFTVPVATPSVADQVYNAGTNSLWGGSQPLASTAKDVATLGGEGTIAATGSVTFTLYPGGTCGGTSLRSDTVDLSDGGATSPASSALAGGIYSYLAHYNGDTNYNAASTCTAFTVSPATTTLSSVVDDGATNSAWTGHEVTGATAYGIAEVDGTNPDFAPTGSVTYTFYDVEACSTGVISTSTKTLTDGTVPNSVSTSPLVPGTYYFKASYTGDNDYTSSAIPCTSFVVNKAPPTFTATVDDAANSETWTGNEVTGAEADASSTVTGVAVDGFTPTGNVTYDFYNTAGCEEGLISTSSGSLDGGAPGGSSDTPALAAGTYYFEATYNGDSNYLTASSGCTSFIVEPSPTTTSAAVVQVPTVQGDVTGSTAYDTSSVAPGIDGFTDTGTVTYDFWTNGSCEGDNSQSTVELSGGDVPNSATSAPLAGGSYSFKAVYSGDGNYLASSSGCQQFTVAPATPSVNPTVVDAGTEQEWVGNEVAGSEAFESITLGAVAGFAPTGGLTYSFFGNQGCTGTPVFTQPVTVTDGAVPSSKDTSPLQPGTYSFTAAYTGDSNYLAETAQCYTFMVSQAPSATTETVGDVSTGSAWSGTENQGAAAFDTAAVSGVAGLPVTGTVTYTFYRDGSCSAPAASTEVDTVNPDGTVPSSAATGGLPSGDFSYRASYSGNTDYLPSQSGCSPFSTLLVGYRLFGGDGGVFTFHATYRGSVGFPSPPGLGLHINDFVGASSTATGYWLVESDGGVFAFGTSHYEGSLPANSVTVNDIVGIAGTPDGRGYWMVARDGTIYPFGDAVSHGSLPGMGVHVDDVVAITSLDAGGYTLVGADGAVWTFGDAHFRGSCTQSGSRCPNLTNIVGIASPDAGGYWLVNRSGSVYSFGDALYHGSCPQSGSGCQGIGDVVGIASPDAGGYWLVGANGGVYNFGDARFLGNEIGADLVRPIVAAG